MENKIQKIGEKITETSLYPRLQRKSQKYQLCSNLI